MIHIDNPLAQFTVLALFVMGLVVYPFVKTERFGLTPSKAVALVIALGIAIFSGTPTFLFALLWPLSFIWFPEYWGNYTGFIRGPYIDKKSPPILVSLVDGGDFVLMSTLSVGCVIGACVSFVFRRSGVGVVPLVGAVAGAMFAEIGGIDIVGFDVEDWGNPSSNRERSSADRSSVRPNAEGWCKS